MRHRDLLIAASELEPVAVSGVFERHVSLRWEELRASSAGGRWGAPGAFEVLYLGRPRASVVVEAYRHLVEDELDAPAELAASVVERRLLRCEVDVAGILDLRSAAARERLALDEAKLRSPVGEYEDCWRIGAAAHQLRLSGVIAPAASGLGETLALYPLNLAPEQWPTVTAREIWHGLPPDPRRLRAIEEERG